MDKMLSCLSVNKCLTIKNSDLLKKTLQDIKNLRESLIDLECANPHLFSHYDGIITSGWEFWTTDEILERINEEISCVLLWKIRND